MASPAAVATQAQRGAGRSVQGAPAPGGGRARRVAGLDGLRALAVLLVLVYHLFPGTMEGGVVGVDAFFVISGFLITSLLLTERRRTGSTDLRRFWTRRLRRIVPALVIAVVVVVSVAACLGGDVLLGVRRQVVGAIALVYNWAEIAAGSSYFDLAQPLLLTNVWSLAVEEQFYLVWPLVLIALLRGGLERSRTRRAAVVALALAAASAVEAITLACTGASPSRVYMGTDTHAFGLMAGAALALWHGHATDPSGPGGDDAVAHPTLRSDLLAARGGAGWLGLAGLVACAWWGDDGAAGGSWAGAPTLWLLAGSACALAVVQALTPEVVEAGGPGAGLAWLLERAPLRWVGARSYGLYLWHWPLWVLAFYTVPSSWDPWLVGGGVTALSVGAAAVSYTLIESPIRRLGVRGWLAEATQAGPRKIVALSGMLTSILLLVGVAFAMQPRHSSAQDAIEQGAQALAAATAQVTETSGAQDPTGEAGEAGEGGAAGEAGDGGASGEAAPSAQASADATPVVPPGDQVSVVGDSVALAAAGGLDAAMPGIAVDAKVSRQFYDALPTLQAMDAQYGPRRFVVVALATNGTFAPEDLEAILDYLGADRRLVMVTGFGPARTTWIPGDNQMIADFAAEHPDQVAVADWHAAISGRTDLLAQDQVHPGAEGGRIYAQTVADALASLNH